MTALKGPITVQAPGVSKQVEATALIEPQLVTIPNVEICEVGEEWQLASGPLTLTTEHLQAAAEAFHNDPAVHAPRVRFGHTTEWPVASEPAFGTYQNLRVENDGMTLVGDLTGVPEWFADIAAAAFPNRSMDGWTNATTHTGKTHALVIEAVSFLGVVLPGINTLEDLAGVWSAEAPEGTQVLAGTAIHATRGGAAIPKPVTAAVGTDDLRKEFYNEFAQGDRYWWWIRQTFLDPELLIVDDDEGGLWAVEYSVAGDTVTFSEPEAIFTQYVYTDSGQVAASAKDEDGLTPVFVYKNRVTASSGKAQFVVKPGSQAAAVYANVAESRPQDRNKEDESVGKPANASTLTVERDAIIKRLGLPEDATDEDITTALAAEPDPAPDPAPEDDPAPEPEDDEEDDEEGDDVTATRTVPKAEWDDTQRRLAAHDERERKREASRRDDVVSAAVKKGRIARARAQAWRKKFDADPEGTETLLTASEDKGGLPENLVPVEEQGTSGGDDVTASTADDTQQGYYNTHFPELASKE